MTITAARINGANIVTYPLLSGEVGVTNTTYRYGDIRRHGGVVDGTTDDATAVRNTLTSLAAIPYKRLYIPAGPGCVMKSGISGIIGNNGYHGLAIVGDSTYGSRILKQFNGDLFQMAAVLNLTVDHIGFDGGYGTYTGKGFVLTGNCNRPRITADFIGFSDSHIELGPDCGYNGRFHTNHFTGAGQGDYRAIHVAGPDTTATPRRLDVEANGYVQLDGALDTRIVGGMATRYEIDNNCNETCIVGSIWADQQNFLAGTPISIGGSQTQIAGCRFANAVVFISGSSGSFVGNKQSGSPIGLVPLDDNSGGAWCIVHPAFNADYSYLGRGTMTNAYVGEILSAAVASSADANRTLTVDVDASFITIPVPLTANRTYTLSTTNARNGSMFWIKRNGGDTGGPWTLTIAGGTGASILNNQSALMVFNGSFWEHWNL